MMSDWERQRDIEVEGQRAAVQQDSLARALGINQPLPAHIHDDWTPTTGLKFIKTKDGRHLLHQLWRSLLGNVEWRPVPLEEEV